MYRALYGFKSDNCNALCFSVGDRFTVIDCDRDKHWWMVQNGKGQVGYVPANYMTRDDVAHAEVIESIDRAISAIRASEMTPQQKSNLQKLLHHRQTVVEEHRASTCHGAEDHGRVLSVRRVAPPPPTARQTSQETGAASSTTESPESNGVKKMAEGGEVGTATEDGVTRGNDKPSTQDVDPSVDPSNDPLVDPSADPTVDPSGEPPVDPSADELGKLSADLVEVVRKNTHLSHELSRVAVATVLTQLRDSLPQLEGTMDAILLQLVENKASCSETHDENRLRYLFAQLTACKDDSQQRSWFLHEDEHVISGQLQELLSILIDADASICRSIICTDHYSPVHNLVLYYQMETRISLRLLLLKVFAALCHLERRVISELLHSVLPLELARDMQTNVNDIQRLSFSAVVLTMIFSIGEPPPIHHYEYLNEAFLHFLLDHIETPLASDVQDKVPDLFVSLLLAFNLHVAMPTDNVLLRVLPDSPSVKVFTEKLLLLVNRAVDPVRMFDHEPAPPNSILKLMSDLYSSPTTANLLYTNDVMVLIDIILRQLTDLPPADNMRTEYLSLLLLVMSNSDCLESYVEPADQMAEVRRCLGKIASEDEEEGGGRDKRIVTEMLQQFPQYRQQP